MEGGWDCLFKGSEIHKSLGLMEMDISMAANRGDAMKIKFTCSPTGHRTCGRTMRPADIPALLPSVSQCNWLYQSRC